MFKATFKQADIRKHAESRIKLIEMQMLTYLRKLGEDCVNMSKSNIDNNPAAFPVSYGKPSNNKPLRQRKISKRDLDRNPSVTAPPFGDFLDYTAVLRNSIGYAILKDGRVIESTFEGSETSNSMAMAREAAAGMRKGYGLVVCAGADYAVFVESKGYDVISSSEIFAENELPKLIQRMKKGISK